MACHDQGLDIIGHLEKAYCHLTKAHVFHLSRDQQALPVTVN